MLACQIENNFCVIHLGTSLKIKSIHQLKEILSQALTLNKPIQLDANQIKQVDTASLQLLLSFILWLIQNNIKFEWQNPSMIFIKTTELLGMKRLLQLTDAKQS